LPKYRALESGRIAQGGGSSRFVGTKVKETRRFAMKRVPSLELVLLSCGVLLIGIFGFGCEGDEGPAGPAGAEGPSGTAECFNCHTDDFSAANYLLTYIAEYGVSQHANGDTWVRKGSSCSRCHTTEGFQHLVATGEQIEVAESSPIGCFACHAPHSEFDFGLRVQGAMEFIVGDATYDKGSSNTCATCHQGRAPSPDFADGTELTNKRFGPHHGPQSNILNGAGAYEFEGAYSTAAAHNLAISDGCVGCHMAEIPGSGNAGGHSFSVTFEYHGAEEVNSSGCSMVGCHPTWEDDDEAATEAVEEAKAGFQLELDALRQDLITLGWLDEDDYVPVPQVMEFADDMGAIWNFQMLREDRSGGIHNIVFANAVLEATQAYVDTRLP
jgi:hypothetical protein